MNTKNDKFKELEDIVEIKELNQVHDVNSYIKLGWKLIDTYKTSSVSQSQSIKYCMGRPKSAVTGKPTTGRSIITDSKASKKFVYSI